MSTADLASSMNLVLPASTAGKIAGAGGCFDQSSRPQFGCRPPNSLIRACLARDRISTRPRDTYTFVLRRSSPVFFGCLLRASFNTGVAADLNRFRVCFATSGATLRRSRMNFCRSFDDAGSTLNGPVFEPRRDGMTQMFVDSVEMILIWMTGSTSLLYASKSVDIDTMSGPPTAGAAAFNFTAGMMMLNV